MNVLCFWYMKSPDVIYNEMIAHFNAKKFIYFYNEEEEKAHSLNAESEAIQIYTPIEYYKREALQCKALNKEIMEAMLEYEGTTDTLIYRWRNTLLNANEYSEIKELYYLLVRYWNDYLDKNEIGLYYIADLPHSVHEYIIYALCRVKGIKTILTRYFPPANGAECKVHFETTVATIYDTFEKDYETNKQIFLNSEPELSSIFEDYFGVYSTPKESEKTLIASPYKKFTTLKLVFERTKIYLQRGEYKRLLRKTIDFLKRKIIIKNMLAIVESMEELPQENEPFVLMLLHLQPEASTCPASEVFDNQRLAIDILSQSLPEGVKLYVKEHPAYWKKRMQYDDIRDYRSKDFYEALHDNAKIRVIKHDLASQELSEKALAVASVNGSVIWENVFKGKPTIMFGNGFFEYMDGVYKVGSVQECRQVMREIEAGTIKKSTPKNISVLLKTMEDVSAAGMPFYSDYIGYGEIRMTEEENYKSILNGILRFYDIAYGEKGERS